MNTRQKFSAFAAIGVALSTFVFAVAPAEAMDKANPDWPCVWRKTLALDAATIWDGPAIDPDKSQWRSNDAVRKMSEILISRRVTVEAAEAEVKKFAASVPEAERDARLLDLFTAILVRTNDERKTVVNGIERFHKRQLARAAEIEKQGITLPKQGEPLPTEPISGEELDKLSPEEERYKWDVRVFLERQQNIPLACEIPQLMDERAGALARSIRGEMKN